MRLIFMGTPTFVVPVLDRLYSQLNVEVVGVYTPPDRPGVRGHAPEMPPVKGRALELGLIVFQPPSLRSAQVQEELTNLQPDVIVVAAYGRFLPTPVLDIPKNGCLNIHPSLLPKYRGPSPVVTAILDGEMITGVTLMLLDPGMDTGPLIAQRQYDIASPQNADSLTALLFDVGADLLLDNLDPWVNGELAAQPQDPSLATVTSKVERADGKANWGDSAMILARKQRAYTPWPGLFTYLNGQVLKLLEVVPLPATAGSDVEPGMVISLMGEEAPIGVGTNDGVLGLKTVQLEGRRAIATQEFLRGNPDFINARL